MFVGICISDEADMTGHPPRKLRRLTLASNIMGLVLIYYWKIMIRMYSTCVNFSKNEPSMTRERINTNEVLLA